ncbi:MAG: hypothetical protein AAGA10_27440 [Bacteroidota bacterium]
MKRNQLVLKLLLCFAFLFTTAPSLASIASPNKEFEPQDSLGYELHIIRKRRGTLKKKLKVGHKVAFWLIGDSEKKRGVITQLDSSHVEIDHIPYDTEAFQALSKARYHRGIKIPFILLGLFSSFWGFWISFAMAWNNGLAVGLLFLVPSVLLVVEIFSLPPKWKSKKFEFVCRPKGSEAATRGHSN